MNKINKKQHFADQYEDENVLLVFRRHPVVMRKGLIFSSIALLLGVIPTAIKPELGFGWFIGGIIAGLMLAVIVFFPFWLSWYFSLYIMTDQRFIQISQKSMFNKSVVDIILSQVQMVNYEIAGLQETLLGFGTIMIQTYVGELVIKDVHHPSKIQKAMLKILRDNGLSPNTVSPFVKQENVSAEEP